MTLLVPVSAPSFSPGALRPLAPVSLLSVSMPLPVTSPARQSVEVAPLPMRAAEPAAAVAAANKRGGTESDGIMDRVFDGALPASSGDGVVAEDPRQEAPAWEQTVLTELPRLLEDFESTREHARFARGRGVTFHLAGSREDGMGSRIATYEAGEVRFNRDVLGSVLMSLQVFLRLDQPQAARMLALRLLPYAAHELRHGMMIERIREREGMTLETASIENEVVSYWDQVRVLASVADLHPESFRVPLPVLGALDASLLRAWASGPQGLVDHVRSVYSEAPSILSLSSEELLRQQRAIHERLKDAATARLSADELPPMQVLAEHIRKAAGGVRFFTDRGRARRLKAMYRELLADMARDWASPEWTARREREARKA
jgi:hypothetical protein